MTITSQALGPDKAQAASPLSTLALFGFVVTAWSLNWVVMKVAVQEVRPLWAVAIRTALAALVLFPPLLATKQLRRPRAPTCPSCSPSRCST
ncbi:EamA family transporter [Methylobacterium sp. P31]